MNEAGVIKIICRKGARVIDCPEARVFALNAADIELILSTLYEPPRPSGVIPKDRARSKILV